MTKKEQLRAAFSTILNRMIKEVEMGQNVKGTPAFSDYWAGILLKEVSIRTPLK